MSTTKETRIISIGKDAGAVARLAAERLIYIRQSCGTNPFTIVLAGGSTPLPLYKQLTMAPYSGQIRQKSTYFFFGDERCVPPTDPESNYRSARESLFEPLEISDERIFRMAGELHPDKAAQQYEDQLRDFFETAEGFPRFDVVILGLGADGHTASLFPETTALYESRRLVVSNFVPSLGYRLTMTFPLINNAANILFLVTGPSKAEAAHKLLDKGKSGWIPACEVAPASGSLYLFLDEDAASEWKEPGQ